MHMGRRALPRVRTAAAVAVGMLVDVNLSLLAGRVDINLGIAVGVALRRWRRGPDGYHAMVDVAIVSDDFTLDSRAFDDLGLRRRGSWRPLLLLLSLDNPDALSNWRRRAGSVDDPGAKSLEHMRRRASRALALMLYDTGANSAWFSGPLDMANTEVFLSPSLRRSGTNTPCPDDALSNSHWAGRSPSSFHRFNLPLPQNQLAGFGAPILPKEGGNSVAFALADANVNIIVISHWWGPAGSTALRIIVAFVEIDAASARHCG